MPPRSAAVAAAAVAEALLQPYIPPWVDVLLPSAAAVQKLAQVGGSSSSHSGRGVCLIGPTPPAAVAVRFTTCAAAHVMHTLAVLTTTTPLPKSYAGHVCQVPEQHLHRRAAAATTGA